MRYAQYKEPCYSVVCVNGEMLALGLNRNVCAGIRREAWKPREDTALAMLYEQWGSQWSAIAKGIPGRTAQQCRARCGTRKENFLVVLLICG